MYGHVPHENRKQFALSSTNNKLPHVGQNNNMIQMPLVFTILTNHCIIVSSIIRMSRTA